jgi:hypothetical protein
MKKISLWLAGLAITATSLHSCTFNEDINTDPINPSSSPLSALLSSSEVGIGYTYGGNQARFSALFTQQLNGYDRQHLAIGRYNIGQQDTDDTWDNYYRIMNNLKLIIDQGKAKKSPHYAGVARILMAVSLGNITDLFGDAPYSQAFKAQSNGSGLQPIYDKQEDLYKVIQLQLDSAIVNLSQSSIESPAADDLIYGGDLNSWKAVAYALKARYHLHLKNKVAGSAQLALTNLDSAYSAGFASMLVKFAKGQTTQSPFFQFNDQRGDVEMASTLIDTLIKYKDPRISFYSDGDLSSASGSFPGTASGESSFPGPYLSSEDSPITIIGLSELKFIEAEAALAVNDAGRAAAAHNSGVATSLMEVTDSSSATYTSATYIQNYGSETASSISLKTVMVQKYLASFLSTEAWTDWRRTGFPEFPPALDNSTNNVLPRRFPYPQKEKTLNAANVPSEGTSPALSRVWWDK